MPIRPENKARRKKIYTLGYSGYSIGGFVAKLLDYQVSIVVDVRRRPVSRKQGFSKKTLQPCLSAEGIEYIHVPELGVPDWLRSQLRHGDISLESYLDHFRDHLNEQREALDSLCHMAIDNTCCIICLESDPKKCHRNVVAEIVSRIGGFDLIHL